MVFVDERVFNEHQARQTKPQAQNAECLADAHHKCSAIELDVNSENDKRGGAI